MLTSNCKHLWLVSCLPLFSVTRSYIPWKLGEESSLPLHSSKAPSYTENWGVTAHSHCHGKTEKSPICIGESFLKLQISVAQCMHQHPNRQGCPNLAVSQLTEAPATGSQEMRASWLSSTLKIWEEDGGVYKKQISHRASNSHVLYKERTQMNRIQGKYWHVFLCQYYVHLATS